MPERKPPFQIGDRIRLGAMPNDPDPIPAGTEGTVSGVPQWFGKSWQIEVDWDSGRGLSLVMPPDRATKVGGPR